MNANDANEEAFQLGYDSAAYGVNRRELEAMGERAVRDDLNTGKYGHPGLASYTFVTAWLADKAFARDEALSAKRDARETETLSVAKDANAIARSARNIALFAVFIAIVVALLPAIK